MSGGWGCPHEVDGRCQRVQGRECDPGMKGCVLHGRFLFSNPDKNTRGVQRRKGTADGPSSASRPQKKKPGT